MYVACLLGLFLFPFDLQLTIQKFLIGDLGIMDEKRPEKTDFDGLFFASERHDDVNVMCFDLHIPFTASLEGIL